MKRWIALFRGINVGGKNSLPMKPLAELLRRIDCADVQTYIQSGNVALSHEESDREILAGNIALAVEQGFGFRPVVVLLRNDELQAAFDLNPFPQALADPKTLHLYFLHSRPTEIDNVAINALKSESEEYRIGNDVFYLYAPAGIGRSRLAAKVEKLIGVSATARNFRTVMKLREMAVGSLTE